MRIPGGPLPRPLTPIELNLFKVVDGDCERDCLSILLVNEVVSACVI